MRKQTLAAAALMLGATLLSAAPAAWSATKVNMAVPYPDSDYVTQVDTAFAKDVAELTDGAVDITVHSSGSLVPHPQILNATRSGQIAMGEILMSTEGNSVPLYEIDSLAFLTAGHDDSERLWDLSKKQIIDDLESKGLTYLYSTLWPAQGLVTKKAIDDISDFGDLKMRVYNAQSERLAKTLGSSPVLLEVPDVPQAFTTGLANAMFVSPATAVSSQAWDYADKFYPLRAWAPRNLAFINTSFFEGLDDDTQQAIMQAAENAQEHADQLTQSKEAELTAELESHGVEIIEPSAELMQELQAVGDKLIDEWLQKKGPYQEQRQAIVDDFREQQ